MQLSTTQAEKIFNKLKIKEKNSGSNHHISGFIVNNGEILFPPIYYSKGKKDMPKPVVEKFRKSLKLDKNSFLELSKCHMSFEEYFQRRNDG